MSDPTTTTGTSPADERIYVGYLPLPGRHARLLRVVVPVLLWFLLGVNAASVLGMRTMGRGVWATELSTWSGTLYESPYPHLLVEEGGGVRTVLLVEVGKIGAQSRAAGLDGVAVSARGLLLERDGQAMLELDPTSDAITETGGSALRRPAAAPGPAETLRGELLDAKCFLGAMKPGAGETHRACARLCVRGGIPPMLAVEADGVRRLYLVTGGDAGPAPASIADRIGPDVELRGRPGRLGSMRTFALD